MKRKSNKLNLIIGIGLFLLWPNLLLSQSPDSDDHGTLILLRKKALTGSAVSTDYTINGKDVGGLTNGSHMKLNLHPGTYVITARLKGPFGKQPTPLTIEVMANELTYVYQRFSTAKELKSDSDHPLNLTEYKGIEGEKVFTDSKSQLSKKALYPEEETSALIQPQDKATAGGTELAQVPAAQAGLPTGDGALATEVMATDILNRRDSAFLYFQKTISVSGKDSLGLASKTVNERKHESLRKTKLSNSELGIDETLKYRRSSLYTLMAYDPTRQHEEVIKDAFGNSELSDNFDNHNVGPYLVSTDAKIKDQTQIITDYLDKENIARQLVAKWFNRQNDGTFDMDLIADRGKYDASVFDTQLAVNTVRGRAMLSDAGEELINNTFVVVHDLNFTNKEEVAGAAKKGLAFVGQIAEAAGFDYGEVIGTVAGEALGVAGKGYVVKTRTYLFRLDWNDEVSNYFYENHWVSENAVDQAKIEAFNKSDRYKLKYIGSEVAWADVQSTIMSGKTNEQLIEKATVKAIDKALANLQKEFDEFRVKTPLVGVEPLRAKIGMKEGLEKGDRFEVLEQVEDENGRTLYKRKGIVTVDKKRIWDNRFEALEDNPEANNDPFTYFKGVGKFYPGMLIRQIN